MLDQRGYDLCVIGSGVAGALVASVAARRGQRVVIIEAGKNFERGSRIEQIQRRQILGSELWPWQLRGRDAYRDESYADLGYEYTLNRSRIKGVGGTTLHWEGMVNRFWPSDFNSAERWGIGADWPISYDELEPYYCLAKAELGVSGQPNLLDPPRSQPYPMNGFPPRFGEAAWVPVAESLGISLDNASHARNSRPYRGRPQCAAFAYCNACPIGARYSADVHIDDALSTGNVQLLTETVARRIDVDAKNDVAQVRATTLSGQDIDITANSYVIAAHAIESAR
jgi:choline dehydrogenase-like flavoprotein